MDPVITLKKEHSESGAGSTWAADSASLAVKLSEIREQLSTSLANVRVESYSKLCEVSTEVGALSKRLEELNGEYERTKWKMKFGASVLVAAIGIASFLGVYYGYKDFYRDIKSSVTQQLQAEIRKGVVSDDRSFYDDLLAGNALNAAGQHEHAIARLMSCFKEGHYYDSAVLLPLLDSIYKSDDWENGTIVLGALEKDMTQFDRIRDATILAYIGSIEVQAAGVNSDWLEKGYLTLQRAQLLTPPGDTATLIIIHTNYWVYDIQQKDWTSAEAEIDAMKQLDASVLPFDVLKRSRFFTQYFARSENKQFEARIKLMWSGLKRSGADT